MSKSIIRQLLTTLVLFSVAPVSLRGQECPDPKTIIGAEYNRLIFGSVKYLSDDALGGRLAGSEGERCAGEYIAQRFKYTNLKPFGDNGTYFQSFALTSAMNPHAPGGTGRNVIGYYQGGDPVLKNEYIIVGAHYDHLGMGRFGSTSPDTTPAIHNGADDNASGVGALIAAAIKIGGMRRPARSMVFVAFSGEEEGLLGSAYFTEHAPFPLTQARAMINLDMVGRLGHGPLIVYGMGTAAEWKTIVTKVAEKNHVAVNLVDDGYGASDHTSFYLKDIPVLHLFTNVHSDYHQPGDDWDKIDQGGMLHIATMVAEITHQLADKRTTLTLIKGAGKPPAPAGAPRGSGASLGTIPDMGAVVARGVKLSGVRGNSPADSAGLKAGDIILKFDDTEIEDLQGMADALRTRKPGEHVRITVLRDGKELVLDATFGESRR
jgi:hypothetical protein